MGKWILVQYVNISPHHRLIILPTSSQTYDWDRERKKGLALATHFYPLYVHERTKRINDRATRSIPTNRIVHSLTHTISTDNMKVTSLSASSPTCQGVFRLTSRQVATVLPSGPHGYRLPVSNQGCHAGSATIRVPGPSYLLFFPPSSPPHAVGCYDSLKHVKLTAVSTCTNGDFIHVKSGIRYVVTFTSTP